MAFMLDSVVPWGRTFAEYKLMFSLNDVDLKKKIAGFGDGPASFNFEGKQKGYNIASFDPIYQFSKEQLEKRIEEVRSIIMKQTLENKENFIWTKIKSLDELENIRMSAMKLFVTDYEVGKKEGRYIYHELPRRLEIEDKTFDIGLSSHFLLMYTQLGYDFHINSISEMLRICKEIRIFPICDLDSNASDLTRKVMQYFKSNHIVEIVETDYEFQKNENKMMVIR